MAYNILHYQIEELTLSKPSSTNHEPLFEDESSSSLIFVSDDVEPTYKIYGPNVPLASLVFLITKHQLSEFWNVIPKCWIGRARIRPRWFLPACLV